jgi:hypothetical protein
MLFTRFRSCFTDGGTIFGSTLWVRDPVSNSRTQYLCASVFTFCLCSDKRMNPQVGTSLSLSEDSFKSAKITSLKFKGFFSEYRAQRFFMYYLATSISILYLTIYDYISRALQEEKSSACQNMNTIWNDCEYLSKLLCSLVR